MFKLPRVYWFLIMSAFLAIAASKEGKMTPFLWYVSLLFLSLGYLVGLIAEVRKSKSPAGNLRGPRKARLQIVICTMLIAGGFLGAYLEDSKRDPQPLVVVIEESPLFKDTRQSAQIGVVKPSDALAVKSIRYVEQGTAIQVSLQDGTTGWVFESPKVSIKLK